MTDPSPPPAPDKPTLLSIAEMMEQYEQANFLTEAAYLRWLHAHPAPDTAAQYDCRKLSICEIGAMNPGVLEYMKHWEERAEKAEARVKELEAGTQALSADFIEQLRVARSRIAEADALLLGVRNFLERDLSRPTGGSNAWRDRVDAWRAANGGR